MNLITNSRSLEIFCDKIANDSFITVDTEFVRDKKYYPKLCLIQIAGENGDAVIDPLSTSLDLTILSEILDNEKICKVFHSARQDLEIILYLFSRLPKNIYDTQIAAMVCGFGESVSYAKLVDKICGATIDKSSRFSDWSKRPLHDYQLEYALNDVTYLRDVYKYLVNEIKTSNRSNWITEHLRALTTEKTYRPNFDNLWRKIAKKNTNRRFLAAVKELTILREKLAQQSNLSRNYVFSDNSLCEIAAIKKINENELSRSRALKNIKKSWIFGIIEALEKAKNMAEEDLPKIDHYQNSHDQPSKEIAELLKVLLKLKSEQKNVAEKLICSSQDIREIISTKCLPENLKQGWRYDIFGLDALRLLSGEATIGVKDGKLELRLC